MRLTLIAIYIFIVHVVIGQTYEELKSLKGSHSLSSATVSRLDKTFNLESLNSSHDILEVRLYCEYFPNQVQVCRTLSYDGQNWTAKEYKTQYDSSSKTMSIKTTSLKPRQSFKVIYIHLKKEKVFELPDQSSLKKDMTIFDGAYYNIALKAGSVYKTYSFNNPSSYSEAFKGVKEFTYYQNIITIFNKDLH